jgi:hypothetical protein
MNCDQLIHERVTLFRNILDIVPSFTTMSDVEQFMFVLTSHDLDICKVVIVLLVISDNDLLQYLNYIYLYEFL